MKTRVSILLSLVAAANFRNGVPFAEPDYAERADLAAVLEEDA